MDSQLFRTQGIDHLIAEADRPGHRLKKTLGWLGLTTLGVDAVGNWLRFFWAAHRPVRVPFLRSQAQRTGWRQMECRRQFEGGNALMRRRVFAALPLLLIVLLAGASSSFGWGENAERIITNKAVDSLPPEMQPFFQANRQFLVQHVTDPEQEEQASDPGGFIRLDHYGQFPFSALPRSYTAAVAKYTRRMIDKYGLLPWQIGTYSKKLTDALAAHDWAGAKLSAAILAHYVAAANDPFNTTINHDGSLSEQPGVNGRFGVALVGRYQLFFFVKPNEAAFIRDPTDYAFDMALGAHAWLENILLADMRAHQSLTSYGDAYYDRFYAQAGAVLIRQLSDASSGVGSYWMTAWINAGRPQLPSE